VVTDILFERLKEFQKNVSELYRAAYSSERPQLERFLSSAYKELGTASEEMQVVLEQMMIQTEELTATQIQLMEERQHYKNLFNFLPNAHIVTDSEGKILQANPASAFLLNVDLRFINDKPLDVFLTPQERRSFAEKLRLLKECDRVQKWTLVLQPRQSEPVGVFVIAAPSRSCDGKDLVHWSLQDLSQEKQASPLLQNTNRDKATNDCVIFRRSPALENGLVTLSDPTPFRPKHIYHQGEIILLEPNMFWWICQGWVKLSTTNSSGEQMLIGLAGAGALISSSMTSLATYQATTLSESVSLVCFSQAQIEDTPGLKDLVYSQTLQRLRQTESLLVISQLRQIQERLQQLLEWLKENFGQKVSQGTRLSIRLTHEEIASACGTTRVTITRALCKLKQQGKLIYDSDRHLIFVDRSKEKVSF
jgi:CRP-like cAMP-binding protein/PAS domain-containing protein